MAAEPVILTGMGVISSLGTSISETRVAFRQPVRVPVPSPFSANGLRLPVFLVSDFEVTGLSRTLGLALHAVSEALSDAGVARFAEPERVGVCIGTTVASQINDIPFYEALRKTGQVDTAAVARYRRGNVAEAVARKIGARGPHLTVSNACSSGADAIGVALGWLRAGVCDAVIAGGADELSRMPICGFHALGVYSDTPCRPFDRDRRGLNLGEAAGIVVLERADYARRRGASCRCEVAGYGAASDAYHLTAPRPDGTGVQQALRWALEEAGADPESVAFVNAHGTATSDNDRVEGNALSAVFGEQVKVLSTKGFTGHTLGAAGAIEAIFTAMGLMDEWVPASAGLVVPDPDIPVHILSEEQKVVGAYAVSTSLAFGGCNAALVMRRVS